MGLAGRNPTAPSYLARVVDIQISSGAKGVIDKTAPRLVLIDPASPPAAAKRSGL